MRFLLILLILTATLSGCVSVKESRLPWSDEGGYFTYYGVQELKGNRSCARIGTGDESLWTWSVTTADAKGTVLFIHGYLDHSALSLPLFRFLNDLGYRVVTYDLPGHGLSGGERGGLGDFSEYRESLDRIMDFWQLDYEETLLMGHSTGGAIILDRLLEGRRLKGAVLAAPLIRFSHFSGALFLTRHLFHGNGTVRVSRKPSSHDTVFNEKKNNDPLAIKEMPLNWPLAIGAWETDLPRGEIPCETPVLILQGGKDRVVDFKENIPRIQGWFPRASFTYYPDLMHHLFNESDRESLYGEIQHFMDGGANPP